MADIHRALVEHEKHQTHPEAAHAAHTDFATLQAEGDDRPL
ncbi:hypothetical protein [Streptomyces sp. NK15101]|nr:hypothetical protein [Streptomyces sp. NK15101]